ncbi:MAG: biopolymer transporter ExbD [Alphaproteobacteria bacterium]|nr:biopolymer transporter ExbD [Alphaproteobacteria bacterium]
MKRTHHTKAMAKADLTPMLDMVFIMLIFFIVTASFTLEKGLFVTFSKNQGPNIERPDAPIGFQIDSSNRIFHAGRLIDHWSIEAIVKREHTERPKAPVVIETHENAHTRQVVRIYDEAKKAGIADGTIAVVVSAE